MCVQRTKVAQNQCCQLAMGQWIHVHGKMKFMLESNVKHFRESRFTSVLNCEILFTSNSSNSNHFTWNHTRFYCFFHSKSRKIGKIVIHGFNGSCKWWNVKRWSCTNIFVCFSMQYQSNECFYYTSFDTIIFLSVKQ